MFTMSKPVKTNFSYFLFYFLSGIIFFITQIQILLNFAGATHSIIIASLAIVVQIPLIYYLQRKINEEKISQAYVLLFSSAFMLNLLLLIALILNYDYRG